MMARWLRASALGIGFYVLLTGVHYGALWGVDQLRQRWETRLENRYGESAVDREPPYRSGERVVIALDVQLSPYWQEAVGMSALLSLPVAILTGMTAFLIKRATRAAVMAVVLVSNIFLLWLLTQLGGVALAGYLVNTPLAALVVGAIVGIPHGIVAMLILTPGRR